MDGRAPGRAVQHPPPTMPTTQCGTPLKDSHLRILQGAQSPMKKAHAVTHAPMKKMHAATRRPLKNLHAETCEMFTR